MPRLKLKLVLNPENRDDMTDDVRVAREDRVFMRIFVVNDSDEDIAIDHLSAEIFANHSQEVLALAPTDCPHAGDLADLGAQAVCSVSRDQARSGGLRTAGDPANGSELTLAQTLQPDEQVGGFTLGTGKAGLMTDGMPFVVRAGEMVHVADGRSRMTGMIAAESGTTPVVVLGFASIKGIPVPVDPAHARVTVVGERE